MSSSSQGVPACRTMHAMSIMATCTCRSTRQINLPEINSRWPTHLTRRTMAAKNPADTTWPLRWDLLQRYRLIEIIALWEGRLTTNHICDTFGIGRQQASKDLNDYLETIGAGNLRYDKQLKGYRPTESFTPKVTSGAADEYLHLLARNRELNQTFEELPLQIANTEVVQIPLRNL